MARPRVLGQPPPVVARFETVRVSWTAPRRGRGRPVGRPYLVLERRVGVGAWQPVDDDRGVGTVWRQRGRRVTARYEVPGDLAPGRYRFVVQAPVRPVATDAFEVVPSAGLVPLRVLADGDSLRFEARNPCPDPAQLLRRRERRPRGGQVRFTTPAGPGVAHWDAAAVGWRAAVAGAPDVVEVPAGGLVDAHGNRSGPAVRLLVDAPGREDWPASLGPGGGRAPGLFGLGPVGAPTRH